MDQSWISNVGDDQCCQWWSVIGRSLNKLWLQLWCFTCNRYGPVFQKVDEGRQRWTEEDRQRSWQISDPEFQKALQIARAVHPVNRTDKQHVIIACMTKHKKQQNCAKSIPPFMIQQGIVKDLADNMQAWILNESTCPPAVRQLPDGILNLLDVDFYIWMKKIL